MREVFPEIVAAQPATVGSFRFMSRPCDRDALE